MSPDVDEAYTAAVLTAVRGGINFIDTSLNYRHQRSERAIGQAIIKLTQIPRVVDRDELMICTKAGYLVRGALPADLPSDDVVGGMHSMSPVFLRDQLERSRVNLGLETIDVFYLHNPETQFGFVNPDEFYSRLRTAFEFLEGVVSTQRIQYYGAATWEGFRKPHALSLTRMESIAREVGGPHHHFRFIQLPYNLAMPEAFTSRHEEMNGESHIRARSGEPHGYHRCEQRQHSSGKARQRTARRIRFEYARPYDRCAASDSVHQIGAGYHDGSRRYEPHGTRRRKSGSGARESARSGAVSAILPDDRVTFAPDPQTLQVTDAVDESLEEVPQGAAVFVVWPREGAPYLGKTGLLRRRLKRLLRPSVQPSRLLNLRSIAERIEYWPVASRLQSTLVLWDVARQYVPDEYLHILKLRYPPYVKLILATSFQGLRSRLGSEGLQGSTMALSAAAARLRSSNISSWICFNSGGARRIWFHPRTTRDVYTGKWACACVPVSRWWAPRSMPRKLAVFPNSYRPAASQCYASPKTLGIVSARSWTSRPPRANTSASNASKTCSKYAMNSSPTSSNSMGSP